MTMIKSALELGKSEAGIVYGEVFINKKFRIE